MAIKFGRNAVWALAEVGVSSVTLFLIYRLVTVSLGVKAIGIWSLVIATTSLARFGDMGASAGLSRLVAIADAKTGRTAAHYVETAMVTAFVLYLCMALLLFWPLRYLLAQTLRGADFETASRLLPFALGSFMLVMVGVGVTTGLIGQHRTDQKSQLGIVGLILQLLIAAAFVKAHGLVALAWAQIVQNLWLLIAGWVAFSRNDLRRWSFRPPYRWRRAVFSELVGFGMRLQAANLLGFLFEPLTKFVMSSLGGLDALGLYEMANRLILQARQLIIAPSQALTPVFALHEHDPVVLQDIYDKTFAIILPAGLLVTAGLTFGGPLISYIWIGHIDFRFVFFVCVMGLGWFINIIAAPAYLLGVAINIVGWNIAGHIITSLGGPALSLLLGTAVQAQGVAVGAATMLASGSLISMIMNCRQAELRPFSTFARLRLTQKQYLSVSGDVGSNLDDTYPSPRPYAPPSGANSLVRDLCLCHRWSGRGPVSNRHG